MAILGRKGLFVTSVFLVLASYVSIYGFLSRQGQYEGDAIILDKVAGPCLCASAFEVWQPRGVTLATYSGELLANTLGYIFFPLAKLDQTLWHPTKRIEYREMTPAEVEQWMREVKNRK